MARKIPSLGRFLGAPSLYAMAYGEISSSLYYALGITAVYALSLTPVVFLGRRPPVRAGGGGICRGRRDHPRAGRRARRFARRALNDLVGFIAGWAAVLDFVIAISLSALFLPLYLAGAFGQHGCSTAGRPATVAAVAILVVITVVRLVRRTDAYTTGVAGRRARPRGAGEPGGARARAAVLGRRRSRNNIDLGTVPTWNSAGVLAPDRDDRLHRPREGLSAGRLGEGPRADGARQRSHVGRSPS